MFHSLAGILGALAALLVCTFAIWRGRAPERWAALTILVGWFASPMAAASQVLDPQWGVFWIDVAVLLVFGVLLAAHRRLWLAFACAFQALAVASHWAMFFDYRITMNTYLAGLAAWSLGVLLALLAGAWQAHRARRRDAAHERPIAP